MTVISEYLNVHYRSVFMNTSMVSSNRRNFSEYSGIYQLVDSKEEIIVNNLASLSLQMVKKSSL